MLWRTRRAYYAGRRDERSGLSQTRIEFDFHTHSVLSDGGLLPAELARRFWQRGYRAVAIADHVDASNIEAVVPALARGARQWNQAPETKLRLIPGAEITHVPPSQIPALVRGARDLGARIVIVHGETLCEPVIEGTNRAAIEAGADILAHPGLISEHDAVRAAQSGVFLEITARGGHCLTNGHVVQIARNAKALLLIDSDAHGPADIPGPELAACVGLGAGLSQDELSEVSRSMAQFADAHV
jgi:histidinol phosphatase-like PHP family hydrolase